MGGKDGMCFLPHIQEEWGEEGQGGQCRNAQSTEAESCTQVHVSAGTVPVWLREVLLNSNYCY